MMPDDIQMPNTPDGGADSKSAKKSAIQVGQIAVSTSLALIATSAIAHAASYEAIEISDDASVSDELDGAIASAISKRSVRDAVSQSLDIFTRNMTYDGRSISDEFFGGKSLGEWQVASDSGSGQISGGANEMGGGNVMTGQTTDGGLVSGFSCYSNCHGACHGACHGSRGWR